MTRSSATARVALDALGVLLSRGASPTSRSFASTSSCCFKRSISSLACSSSSSSSTSIVESMPLAAQSPKRSFSARSFASIKSLKRQGHSAARETTEIKTLGFPIGRRRISSTPQSSSSSTSTSTSTDENLPDEATFHAAADDELHDLVDVLESWVDEVLDSEDADVEYSSGVLTLRLGDGKGTYVINKQAPNRQLWLSSPVSGPVRYDLVKNEKTSSSSPAGSSSWIYHRDGHDMRGRLREELAGLFGEAPEGL